VQRPRPRSELRPVTVIDPTAALVVIDLQKGIVSARRDDAVDAVVDRSAGLAAAFRAQGRPVVLVNVVAAAPGRTDTRSRTDLRALPPEWAELVEELDAQPSDHLISKRRRSAFHDTGLDTLLRDLGVTQVVLTGIATSSGVESTARSAGDHGYHVVLVTDAMFDPDPELHRNCTERVFPKLGETGSTDEIVELLTADH
jgi:nicotinamidase-related amidase